MSNIPYEVTVTTDYLALDRSYSAAIEQTAQDNLHLKILYENILQLYKADADLHTLTAACQTMQLRETIFVPGDYYAQSRFSAMLLKIDAIICRQARFKTDKQKKRIAAEVVKHFYILVKLHSASLLCLKRHRDLSFNFIYSTDVFPVSWRLARAKAAGRRAFYAHWSIKPHRVKALIKQYLEIYIMPQTISWFYLTCTAYMYLLRNNISLGCLPDRMSAIADLLLSFRSKILMPNFHIWELADAFKFHHSTVIPQVRAT